MTSTVLPRVASAQNTTEGQRHWTPGPAYLPGTSQRDPILGTTRSYTQIQDNAKSSMNKNNNDYWKAIVSSNIIRSLIQADKKTDRDLQSIKTNKKRLRSSYHGNVHQKSVFGDTNYFNTFYVIHPDWTSEPSPVQRRAAKEKTHFSYDARPAVHPLSSYIEPLLEKRRLRDQYITAMRQQNHVDNYFNNLRSKGTSSPVKSRLTPVTQKDGKGNYKGYSQY